MKVITIGRSSKSDVVIHDAYVGRVHMQIVLDNDGNIYAIDMNSTNGTYVNGQRIYGKVRLQKKRYHTYWQHNITMAKIYILKYRCQT